MTFLQTGDSHRAAGRSHRQAEVQKNRDEKTRRRRAKMANDLEKKAIVTLKENIRPSVESARLFIIVHLLK